MTPKEHEAFRAGARAERRALRDAARRELKRVAYTEAASEHDGVRWVLDWLSERIQRTRRTGGVGR